jgi:SAM-dependent methyltransferase
VIEADERLHNDPTSELWGEHRARYRFASQFADGARVLDVACGAGFGMQMLRAAGGCVLGIDLDTSALSEARHVDPTSRLVRADAARLPLPDVCVDLVTSFETVEHVADAAALVRELQRVLRSGGRLVLSTPNRAFGPPELHTGNPFHVREFTAPELRDLLLHSFDDVRLYGQWPSLHYRYVPFLLVRPAFEPEALIWKALNRLPFRIKDRIARLLGGRSFYPGEDDYVFVPDKTDGSHALIAVATSR